MCSGAGTSRGYRQRTPQTRLWNTRGLNLLALLRNHVADFDYGVRSGDWSLMLERFADDAELVLDVLGEPIVGVGAIRSAYLDRPPDDEIVLLDAWETADGASGTYAWSREPAVAAGEIRLTVVGGRITRLVVTGL